MLPDPDKTLNCFNCFPVPQVSTKYDHYSDLHQIYNKFTHVLWVKKYYVCVCVQNVYIYTRQRQRIYPLPSHDRVHF